MSIADRVFIENCRDIISNGVWDTDRPVRPRWEDGSPCLLYTSDAADD